MKALNLSSGNKVELIEKKIPVRSENESLIKVIYAGICNTDIELIKGYMGFTGILGHEFIGEIIESNDTNLIEKKVAGEINLGCGTCQYCLSGNKEHCLTRSVLGIYQKDGCFCEYITLPTKNCIVIPDSITNENAVFIEPLAAALRIIQQIKFDPDKKIAILGDGKLGLLISLVLSSFGIYQISLIGHHRTKMDLIKNITNINSLYLSTKTKPNQFDYVIEATGSSDGFADALEMVKPLGTVILKSTVADYKNINLAPIVIKEINLIGSRCGHFKPAIMFLEKFKPALDKLISAVYSIDEWEKAFMKAKDKNSVKVIFDFNYK